MSQRILVIDDDRAIANLTGIWMRAAGYDVAIALSGSAGLDMAAANPPDLVLLDIRMPVLDGFEVMARMRKEPDLSRIPVVFLSANVHEDARTRAAEAGASGFLAKPYEPEDVVATVERVLDPITGPSAGPSVGPSAGS